MLDIYTEKFFNGCFDLLNSGVTKFNDLTGVGDNEVVVLFGCVRSFKLRQVFAKLVLSDQIASQEEFDGVVKCGARDAVVVVLHFDVKRLYIKVTVVSVDFCEYGKAFRSFAVAILLEVGGKNIFYGC